MPRSKNFIPLICALFLIVMATPVFAQYDSAVVLGTIKDTQNSVLPAATIHLQNKETGVSITSTSDSNGDYIFPNVRIGNYRIKAELTGFNAAVVENLVVTVNARQRVDIAMQAGGVTETVTISDLAPLLESESSGRGQVIQREQIVNLPLNGRSYANLALLTPGVRESSQNGITTAGREAAFNVNGLRNTVNNFLLDGVDNNAYGTSNQSFSAQVVQVSPDAIQEFKVQTNTYSAEFGRSGGAVINATYRSGSNNFHGSAWEYHRNTVLNAVGFFKPAGGVKPPLIRNQFGATFGGPIIKDRSFFFVDYEGFRQISKNLVFSSLPTLDQRNGLLTVDVRNPFTGTVYTAGTAIPMTAFARKVLTDLPAPNATGSNNYQNLVPNKAYNDKFNIRLDHKATQNLSLFARISNRKLNNFEGPNIPGPSGSNQNGNVSALNQQLALGATYVVGTSGVLDVRIGIMKTEAGKKPPLTGGPSMLDLYGITGLPTDPTITGGLTTQSIGGLSQLGRQSTNPQFQNPSNVDPKVAYTWTLGRHSLKFGYEWLRVNTDVQDTNPLMGLDTYSGQFSRPTGAASNNLFNLADFMFGARSQYELANLLVVHLRQRLHFGYVQDDFKLTRRLTLNIGGRYEFSTPIYEENNRLSNYDPQTNTIVQASNGSLFSRGLVNPDKNNFAPRIGLAYTIDSQTAIRAGYGIGYIYFNRMGSADLLATNTPQITRAAITQDATNLAGGLCTGNAVSGCFRTTQAGYPGTLPNNVTLYVPKNKPTPYIQNWQVSVQREFGKGLLLDVAYVGNHAIKQALLADYNQARPLTTAELALPAAQRPTLDQRRPIQGFKTISAVLPLGFSTYNALQVKLERRFSKGLYFLNSFTWSKAIDNVSQVLEEPNGNEGRPQNIYNIGADKGLSPYDQPFNNTTSIVWEVPVGRSRKWLADLPAGLDAVLGGWVVTGINSMLSGQTINLRYQPSPVTANLASFLGGVALRPNISGDILAPADQRTIDNYFNKNNISIPSVDQPFGNAGRNIGRSNSIYQLDFGLQKNFPLTFVNEVSKIEFRMEAFNLFNKTNFGAANSDRSSSAFGTIRSTFPARQIQFALRLAF